MSHYPFRHSTYFTRADPVYTSELPPMNSTEDILQDLFMKDRNTLYYGAKDRRNGLKRLMNSFKSWRKGVDSRFLALPRSIRRAL